jgi:hypothetical protein
LRPSVYFHAGKFGLIHIRPISNLRKSADSIGNTSSAVFSAIHFRTIQLVITVGLILCIVGATSSISPTGVYEPQTETKAGVALYLVAFVALCLVAAVAARKLPNTPYSDKRLVWAVILALPFILARLLYSVLSVFAHGRDFGLISGSVIIHIFMAVVEEIVVVIIYLVIGWNIDAVAPTVKTPIASRPWKGNLAGREPARERNGGRRADRRTGRKGRRQGPIHALINAGINAAHREPEVYEPEARNLEARELEV